LPFEYLNAPLFSEGLAAVLLTDAGREWGSFQAEDWHRWRVPGHEWVMDYYVYVDENNNTVLGPYERPPHFLMSLYVDGTPSDANLEAAAFRNGRAINFEGLNYGFIDRTGELVITREFNLMTHTQFGWNEHGYILVCTEKPIFHANGLIDDEQVDFALIDVYGNRILEFRGVYYGWFMRDDGSITLMNNYGFITQIFDSAGNEVPLAFEPWSYINGYLLGRGDPQFRSNTYISVAGNGIDKTTPIPVYSISHIFGDWFQLAVLREHPMQPYIGRNYLWNVQTDELREADADMFFWWHEPLNGAFRVGRPGSGGHLTGLMDSDFNIIIDIMFDELTPINGYFLARQGNVGGLVDGAGNWVVRTPLFGNND
jgi:hypothetical protein